MKHIIPNLAVALVLLLPTGLRGEPDMSKLVQVTISSTRKLEASDLKGKVAVIGAVKEPKSIEFRVGMSVLDAVAAAGGLDRSAIREFQITNWETGTMISYQGPKRGTEEWRHFYSRVLLREGELLHVVAWIYE